MAIRTDRVDARIEALGIGRRGLAARMHCTVDNVDKLRKMKNPQMATVEELARALECSPAWLMGWDE